MDVAKFRKELAFAIANRPIKVKVGDQLLDVKSIDEVGDEDNKFIVVEVTPVAAAG